MPFLYRYINLQEEEVVYVGIVTADDKCEGFAETDEAMEYLTRRDRQHRNDEWYKEIGADNLLLQYIFFESSIDARISELWLINFYDTGQLANKDATECPRSQLDLYPFIFGKKWRNYGQNQWLNEKFVRDQMNFLVNVFLRDTEGIYGNIDLGIEHLSGEIRKVHSNISKARSITRYDAQGDYKRICVKAESGRTTDL